MKDGTDYGIGAEGEAIDWDSIPWDSVDKSIRKLRQRIFRASKEQKWNKVRSLMKLMLRSYFNLLNSVRRVTQKNKGKKTAGVDSVVALTPKARMRLVRTMGKYTVWKAKPARRLYIPKPGKPGERRPLGIPTIRNRVAQAIVKNALEPCWEAQFEPNSYGFRPGRSIHDATAHCWHFFRKGSRRLWILDADIKGAFDNISHDHILRAVGPVPGRELIKQWLKAGYVEEEIFTATEKGVPQGGIISPLLLNVALHGLQEQLGPRYGYVRYADDLIVCASSREKIESARTIIEEWLKPRGLKLHQEKTRITHADTGFNFLGFFVKRYKGKCLVKPQKEKVFQFLRGLRQWLDNHKQARAEHVILHLNPILRGWSNNYRHAVSSRVFAYVCSEIWKMLWRWCLRRHRNKGKGWVAKKYFSFQPGRRWTFETTIGGDRLLTLFDVGSMRIERHVKVIGAASPDDPSLREYWTERKTRQSRKRTKSRKARHQTGSGARAV